MLMESIGFDLVVKVRTFTYNNDLPRKWYFTQTILFNLKCYTRRIEHENLYIYWNIISCEKIKYGNMI